jgi:hypothetical protein
MNPLFYTGLFLIALGVIISVLERNRIAARIGILLLIAIPALQGATVIVDSTGKLSAPAGGQFRASDGGV